MTNKNQEMINWEIKKIAAKYMKTMRVIVNNKAIPEPERKAQYKKEFAKMKAEVEAITNTPTI